MPLVPEYRKRALVTGAARRLGAAFALDLARRGWDLWLHYHTSEAQARELAEKIGALGRRARLVRADLASPGGAELLAERLAESGGLALLGGWACLGLAAWQGSKTS